MCLVHRKKNKRLVRILNLLKMALCQLLNQRATYSQLTKNWSTQQVVVLSILTLTTRVQWASSVTRSLRQSRSFSSIRSRKVMVGTQRSLQSALPSRSPRMNLRTSMKWNGCIATSGHSCTQQDCALTWMRHLSVIIHWFLGTRGQPTMAQTWCRFSQQILSCSVGLRTQKPK